MTAAPKPLVTYAVPMYTQTCSGMYARFHDVIHTLNQLDDPPWRYQIIPLRYRDQPDPRVLFTPGNRRQRTRNYFSRIRQAAAQSDIFHLVEGYFPSSLASLLLAGRKVPIVVGPNLTVGTTPLLLIDHMRNDLTPRERLRLKLNLGRRVGNKLVFHRRSPLAALSDALLLFRGYRPHGVALGGLDAAKIAVMPSGVRRDIFNPNGPQHPYAHPFSILYVGDAKRSYLKGFDLFLAAMQRLKAQSVAFHAYLLGNKQAAAVDALQNSGLLDHATFVGRVPRAQLAAYYRGASVYVSTSRYEMDVTTAMEALACGTPVVGSDLPGVRSTLAFAVGDSAELTTQLIHLQQHYADYKAQALAEADQHDIMQVILQWQQLYCDLLTRRQP